MAKDEVKTEPQAAVIPAREYPANKLAVAALVLGWLVPGGGHFLLKRWGRGALLCLSVVTMFVLGVLMRGKIYSPNTGDLLDMLGFVGDLGTGALYLVSKVAGWGQGSIAIATADYGTKYIIVSGLLNIISAIDAYDIGVGKKS
jgi:hypothetical protein